MIVYCGSSPLRGGISSGMTNAPAGLSLYGSASASRRMKVQEDSFQSKLKFRHNNINYIMKWKFIQVELLKGIAYNGKLYGLK